MAAPKAISTQRNKANIAQVLALLAEVAEKLGHLGPQVAAGKLAPPPPGQRTFTEILAHLLNCEARSAEAIYLALLADNPLLLPIHPERQWGNLLHYEHLSNEQLLAYFSFRRTLLLRVLTGLSDEQWARTISEPGKKRQESVYWLARSLALHELEHLTEMATLFS